MERWTSMLDVVWKKKPSTTKTKKRIALLISHHSFTKSQESTWKRLLQIASNAKIPIHIIQDQSSSKQLSKNMELSRSHLIQSFFFTDNPDIEDCIQTIHKKDKIPKKDIHYIAIGNDEQLVNKKNKHVVETNRQLLQKVQQLLSI